MSNAEQDQGQQGEGEAWRGKIGRLDQDEMNTYLAQGNVARLGCLDDEGWPYVVPTWYHWTGEGFYIIPRARSAWAEHLKRDGRVYLAIDEAGPPYTKVMVRGVAELVEEPNVGGKWVDVANEMSYRYLGEHGPDYLVPTLNEPRWLFYVRPTKITTWRGVDWAKRYKTAT